MSSTTPSATRNSASLDKLQVEKGRLWSTGRLSATFLISRRSGRVNFGGRPPEYFAANESNPSALKLWMTSLTRSSEVKAILAMAGTSILWADQSTIWALRHRTTEPDPRRTIERSLRPSSLVISLTATRSAMAPLCATSRSKWWTRAPNVAGHGTSVVRDDRHPLDRASRNDERRPWNRPEIPRTDAGLPALHFDHPLADGARCELRRSRLLRSQSSGGPVC